MNKYNNHRKFFWVKDIYIYHKPSYKKTNYEKLCTKTSLTICKKTYNLILINDTAS